MTQLKHRQYTFFIGSLHIKTAIMRRPTHSDEQHQTNTALESMICANSCTFTT